MCARAEFAYLVADIAQLSDYQDTADKMMDQKVYASVMWALVIATVFSPISFRWAIGVYERAFPMHRAASIGGPVTSGLPGEVSDRARAVSSATGGIGGSMVAHFTHTDEADYLSHAFALRIAGKFHWGIHREIVASLYSLGVYVIEVSGGGHAHGHGCGHAHGHGCGRGHGHAPGHGCGHAHGHGRRPELVPPTSQARIHAIDDPDTLNIDHFIASYHLIARGKKLDFDDEKLEVGGRDGLR